MSHATIIFFLSICVGFLICVVLYQQFVFRTGTQAKLRSISDKLKEIIETDSDERVMIFTENKELMELAAQINALLEKYLKTKVDYRRSEIASKKMLSNISHDIKTPMTVILGYLEIMQLNETPSKEMLKKVERKAQSVMELINQFFTLSKIESGDMDIELFKVDICEICREGEPVDHCQLCIRRRGRLLYATVHRRSVCYRRHSLSGHGAVSECGPQRHPTENEPTGTDRHASGSN